jgi:hypothetical protein
VSGSFASLPSSAPAWKRKQPRGRSRSRTGDCRSLIASRTSSSPSSRTSFGHLSPRSRATSSEAGALRDEQEEFLAIAARNAERSHRLTSDLLLISQMRDGKLPVETEPLALTHLLDDCVKAARPAAEAKSVAPCVGAPRFAACFRRSGWSSMESVVATGGNWSQIRSAD